MSQISNKGELIKGAYFTSFTDNAEMKLMPTSRANKITITVVGYPEDELAYIKWRVSGIKNLKITDILIEENKHE